MGRILCFLYFLSSFILSKADGNGLVLSLPFNGNAADESENNHQTTVSGASLTTDRFGNPNSAYYFSRNSYIKVAWSSMLDINSNDYTIAAYIKMDKVTNNMRIFSHGSYRSSTGYMLRSGGKNLLTEFSCNERLQMQFQTSVVFEPNVWYFVATTVQRNGYVKTFIDETRRTANPFSNDCSVSNPYPAYVGFCPEGLDEQFLGSIDEVRVYNRALSEAEVLSVYHELSTLPPTVTPSSSPSTRAPSRAPLRAPTSNRTPAPVNSGEQYQQTASPNVDLTKITVVTTRSDCEDDPIRYWVVPLVCSIGSAIVGGVIMKWIGK